MADGKKIQVGFVGLDFDTVMEGVGEASMGSFPGAYIDGFNFHLGPGADGKGGAIRKVMGTREIPWTPPATGNNVCQGTYWAERSNTMVAFICNDAGNHCLIWHHPTEPTARTILIPALNLSPGNTVTGCALIDNEILVFTDGADYPKMLNLPRADMTGKKLVLNLWLPPASRLVDFREFTVQVTLGGIPAGPLVGPPAFANATTRQVRDFRPMMTHFAAQWGNIATLAVPFTAVSKGEWVELTASAAGDWSATVTVTDYIGGVAQAPVVCVIERENAYNSAWTFAQVRMSRAKPITPPTITMGTDTTRESNLLKGRMFQFCYGFRLKDNERTLTSPVSNVAVPSSGPCGGAAKPNFADVGFLDDKWLNDPAMRGEITAVDILARDGNLGPWLLVESIEKWQWMYSRSYRFFNDGKSIAADSALIDQSMTSLPPVAKGLEVFSDANDNQRVVMGNIKEGDGNLCPDITLEVVLSESPSQSPLVDITGRITIMGVFDPAPAVFGTQHYNFNQPIWVYDNGIGPVYGGFGNAAGPFVELFTNDPQAWGQRIPMGGFPVYIAGTDKYAISEQTNFPASVSGGTVSATVWSPPQGHPSTGRVVYDGSVRGYSLTPTNRTHRDAIRSMIEDDHIYSTFTIKGLERGKTYIVRIASNLCDILDDGSIYDLNATNRGWQRTSTRTVQVGSNDALQNPNGGTYPAGTVIQSGRTECKVTIPMTGPAVIDIGNCVVMDTTNPNPIDGSFVIDGYLFDALGADYSASNDIRTRGLSAEKQLVRLLNHGVGPAYDPFANPSFNILYLAPFLWPALAPTIIYNTFIQQLFGLGAGHPGDYRTYSDHNGYWFFFNKNQVGHSPQAQWCGVTGNPSVPSGVVTATNNPNGTAFYQILNDFPASKWEGGANGALEGALNPVSGNLFNGPGWKQYIFANLLATLTHRTHVKALIQDTNTGNGIPNMTALMQNGRTATSDSNGVVNLVVFGDVVENLNRRYVDELLLYNNTPCTVAFTGGNSRVVNIDRFTPGGDYSESPDTNWFDLHFIVPIMASAAPFRASCFSRGGTYTVGGAFGRWDGSGTAVKELAVIRVPNLGEDLTKFDPLQWPPALFPGGLWSSGVASIRWTLAGAIPPAWIGDWEYFQLYVTADETRNYQLQWVAGQVTYSTGWDQTMNANTGGPTPTTYSNGNAVEVYIVLTDSLVRFEDLNSSSTLGYQWQEGDILRILSGASGGQVFSVQEYEITGQRGKWITVRADSSMPEITAGTQIEIFTPALAEDDASGKRFYAVPDGLVLINDPYGSPSWSVTTGLLERGDTWLIPTNVPFRANDTSPWSSRTMTRESKSFSDTFESRSWDRGKVLFVIPDAKVKDRGVLMRFSNSFKPGTFINGLNIYEGNNFREAENFLGEIVVMIRIQEVIFCICLNGAFSIYVGIEQLRTTPESLQETTGGILGNVRPFAHRFGTRHPLSVQAGATTVMYFCQDMGAIVQYGSNALADISAQNNAHAYVTLRAMNVGDNTVCTGVDQANGEFLFSFPSFFYDDGFQTYKVASEAISYHDKSNRFISRRSFHYPDCWGRTRLKLFSFADGRLWEHNATNNLGEIYGNQTEMSVTPVFTDSQLEMKSPKALWIYLGPRAGATAWDVPMVETSYGQQSLIPLDKFTTRAGGVSKAAFLKDMQSGGLSNGDPLVATSFAVTLRHQGQEQCSLTSAVMIYQEVEDTM
jgi:hypothetical protein